MVLYPEVDWRGVFADKEESQIASLRGDPRRNSTTTIHLAGAEGRVDATGRPVAGQRTYWMGPAQRVVAGQLRYAYLERSAGKVTLDKSLDPAEILREYRAGLLGPKPPTGSTTSQRAQTAPAGAARTRGPVIPLHRPVPLTAREQQHSSSSSDKEATKLIYFDGRQHHVVDAPEGHQGPKSVDKNTQGIAWEPPHLSHKDLAPGRFLGVVETPGTEGTKLVASKHRMMPDFSPRGYAGTGRYAPFHHVPGEPGALGGMSQETLARKNLADSVRTYALTHKPIGHKEYEAATRQLVGVGCWEATQSHLSASMHVGRPSRQMSPFEHTTTRLSLRRPVTSRW